MHKGDRVPAPVVDHMLPARESAARRAPGDPAAEPRRDMPVRRHQERPVLGQGRGLRMQKPDNRREDVASRACRADKRLDRDAVKCRRRRADEVRNLDDGTSLGTLRAHRRKVQRSARHPARSAHRILHAAAKRRAVGRRKRRIHSLRGALDGNDRAVLALSGRVNNRPRSLHAIRLLGKLVPRKRLGRSRQPSKRTRADQE